MEESFAPLLWFDMEMTGLDLVHCVPLQVAMVVTSSNLEELDSLELTLWQPDEALARMDPFVRKMHTENGLIELVKRSEVSMLQAERSLMQCVTRWCPYGQGVLAGNSIHTDRRFIIRYFPAFDGYLHYRMIDVSSIKELALRWYGRSASFNKPVQNHTALSDTRESIAELRHYRALLMKPTIGSE